MVGDRRGAAMNGNKNGGGDTSLVLSEGEEKRRLVLERKAQQDQEKHERLVRRLTLVEDRRQSVIEERKRKAQEASARLNERLAQVSANRRLREQQDREKREAAVRRRDTTNSERSASAAANLTSANRNGFPKSNASANGGHLSGGVPVRSASTHVSFSPRIRDGTSSRLTKNRLSQPTIELDTSESTAQRSKSSRYSSATALPTNSYRSTNANRNTSTPIPNTSSTLPRSKSQRLPVTSGTASSSGTSSARTSTDSARGGKLASEKGKTESGTGPASTAASLRRAQSLSAKRKPIPPREPIEKKEKPTAHKETPASRPATKQPLMPKIDFSQKANKVSPAPSGQPVASSSETTSVEVSSAELEFKKKLAEKRRLARENQLKKEEEAAMATKVVAYDPSNGAEAMAMESNTAEPQVDDSNEKTHSDANAQSSIVTTLEGVGDSSEPAADNVQDFGRFDEAVTSLQSVVSSRQESSAETSPRDGPSSAEKENNSSLVDDLSDAERKKKEREARVAERMRLMEAEREQERSKKEAEEREREEREKEREKQLDEQRQKEEEERRARKAKLDAIMARTRIGGGGASSSTSTAGTGVSASTALSSGAASAILANIRQNQKPQQSLDKRPDEEERETDAEMTMPSKKPAELESTGSVNHATDYDVSIVNNIEVNHVYSSSGDSRGGAGNEFVTTSVEHESPGGSKIASPCGAETMSPVPDRHNATHFVLNHHSKLTTGFASRGDENGNLNLDQLDRDDDKHFEQIIELGSESRFVNGHQQEVSGSKSDNQSPTLDSGSQQKFGLTESRQVSGDNDNAEHSQFPF